MKTGFTNAVRRYLADESGISAGIVALAVVFLVGMGGLSVDLGYAYSTRVKLQAATNAAALAGAYYIGTGTDPTMVALRYSALSGEQNGQGNGFPTTMVANYPKLLCLTTFKTSNPCLGSGTGYPTGGANAIRVMESARSPTFFAGVFGISYIPVTAEATATSHGGSGKPLDIAIIVDTTASMGNTDATCNLGASATREACAESGIKTLLLNMNPQMAKVQLLAFPGFPTQAQGDVDWACPKTGNPTIVPYWTQSSSTAAPGTGVVYTVTPSFESGYQTGNPVTLNPNSNIVKAVGGNTSCTSGLQTPGGEGTYYAGALSAAQALLAADGDSPNAFQQVIILLSDGESNATNNEVTNITVNNGGAGYNAAPTVVVSPPDGTSGPIVNATATANMTGSGSSQTVSSITINNNGSGYTYSSSGVPNVSVSFTVKKGNTGSGAVATATLSNVPGVNQCNQAVTVANAAKGAVTNTQIYVIAYGSSTSTGDCTTDYSPAIAPCTALADIASDTTLGDAVAFFYSDGSGGVTCPGATPVTDLATAGALIAEALTKVRLVPNNSA